MRISEVNQELCTGCGACAEECPAALFRIEAAPPGARPRAVHQDPHGWCTGCGHCLAVCPQAAIVCEPAAPLLEPSGIEHPERLCSYDTLLPFLQSKRSVRRYRPRPVPRNRIREVLEAMRWAPSGHNLQACRYLVLTDPSLLAAISDHTIAGFRRFRTVVRLRKLLRPFIPRNLYRVLDSSGLLEGLDDMIRRREAGEDPILFDAPAVIVVYYPDMGPLSLLDPTIAFTYGMLAAHSLGLGTCWIGFAIQTLFKDDGMRKLLGIPPDMIVAGLMTLGYPLPVYHRVPPRNEPQACWLGNGDRASGNESATAPAKPSRPREEAGRTAAAGA